MRGLKQLTKAQADYTSESHLLQMRGLKRILSWMLPCLIVASFTDAWIETKQGRMVNTWSRSRIFYRCVDWNRKTTTIPLNRVSRIFYRCVDWNLLLMLQVLLWVVASFTDAWIETRHHTWKGREEKSRTLYRYVDWNPLTFLQNWSSKSYLI